MFETYTFGPLRVVVCAQTGEVKSVQDKLTGVDAAFMYSRTAIENAAMQARNAWASTAELA